MNYEKIYGMYVLELDNNAELNEMQFLLNHKGIITGRIESNDMRGLDIDQIYVVLEIKRSLYSEAKYEIKMVKKLNIKATSREQLFHLKDLENMVRGCTRVTLDDIRMW